MPKKIHKKTLPMWQRSLSEKRAARQGGSPFVIPRLRNHTNNGTQLARIVKEAGLKQWERIIQNLRKSRSEEIFSKYPTHVAEEWMGQSYKVAKAHYLNAKEHVQQAIAPKATVPAADTTGIMAWN